MTYALAVVCAQVMKSANIKTASARKAVLAVLGSRVLGPLRSGMEARVVKSNRFNRILVRAVPEATAADAG